MEIYKQKWTSLQAEIFSFLALNAGKKFSQREIAIALAVSPTAVANSIKQLFIEKLIVVEKTKTINFISFNRDEKKALELKRVENLKNIYSSGLSDYLEESLAGATVIIFGSWARGEDTNTSDIDIAVIGRKEKPLNLEKYEKLLNRNINMNYYNSLLSTQLHLKNNILSGILLHGSIES